MKQPEPPDPKVISMDPATLFAICLAALFVPLILLGIFAH